MRVNPAPVRRFRRHQQRAGASYVEAIVLLAFLGLGLISGVRWLGSSMERTTDGTADAVAQLEAFHGAGYGAAGMPHELTSGEQAMQPIASRQRVSPPDPQASPESLALLDQLMQPSEPEDDSLWGRAGRWFEQRLEPARKDARTIQGWVDSANEHIDRIKQEQLALSREEAKWGEEIPVIGQLNKAGHWVVDRKLGEVAGIAHQLVDNVGGVAVMRADPVGAIGPLIEFAEHIPGPTPNGIKLAKGAKNIVFDGADPGSELNRALNPVASIQDDLAYHWEPYSEEWNNGDYSELSGRAQLEVASMLVPFRKLLPRVRGPKLPSVLRGKPRPDAPAPKSLDDMLRRVPDAKHEIDAIARDIADRHGGSVLEGPPKQPERIQEKLRDFNGDLSRLNDLARNTIVVRPSELEAVARELREGGADVRVLDPQKTPMGFSGVNAKVKTASGLEAEIQANTPAMIYGKASEDVARQALGDELYERIDAQAKARGITGHRSQELYTQWRTLDHDDPQQAARAGALVEEAKRYHDLLRAIDAD